MRFYAFAQDQLRVGLSAIDLAHTSTAQKRRLIAVDTTVLSAERALGGAATGGNATAGTAAAHTRQRRAVCMKHSQFCHVGESVDGSGQIKG